MKKYLCLVLILLNLYLPILMVSKIEAASVSTSFETNLHGRPYEPQTGLISLQSKNGSKISTAITKTINFVLPNGTIASTQSNLNINESIRLSENVTSGSWFHTGGWYDSPNSDGIWYRYTGMGGVAGVVWLYESKPVDRSNVSITSNNPSVLECNPTWGCTAKNPGYAVMTVNFPQANRSTGHRFLSGAFGFGVINIGAYSYGSTGDVNDTISAPYSFDPIYYGVTVAPRPNQNAVASCLPPTNMSTRGGTFNWKYTDAEGDAQSNYHFQLATDPSFTNIIYQTAQSWGNGGMTTTGGSVVIPNGTLFPGVTYYTRIASYNGVNGWGTGFQNCSGNFTTLPIPQPTGFSATCADNGDKSTVKWVNPAGYDSIYFRATDVTVHPDVTLSDALKGIWDKIGLYKELFKEEVQGNSYTFDTIPGHKYLLWIHTKDKNITYPPNVNWSPILVLPTLLTCSLQAGVCATDSQGKQIKDTCAAGGLAIDKQTTDKQYIWKCPSSDPKAPATSCARDIEDIPPPTTPTTPVTPCSGTTCNPLISIKKTPLVVLDKNGSCTLDWTITNLQSGVICSLNGWGVNGPDITSKNIIPKDKTTINNLQSSQKYTITCSGGPLTSPISASVLCRVNTDINEI